VGAKVETGGVLVHGGRDRDGGHLPVEGNCGAA